MRFESKKNRVMLEAGVVLKHHDDGETLLREAHALEQLHQAGLAVPALLGIKKNTLKLEYIEGPTYVDLVDTMTLEQAEGLAAWLAEYHRLSGMLRGDCNLRNFLWSQGQCVGVDFEDEGTVGEPESDMGKILAFAVTYSPPFTPNKAACGRLLLQAFRATGGDLAAIKDAYLVELAAMNQRRQSMLVHPSAAALFFDGLC